MGRRCSFKRLRGFISTGLVVAIIKCVLEAKAVTIAWNANPEADLAGYRLFWGETNTAATVRDVGRTNQAQVTNLVAGRTYYFRLTAYNTAGLESNPSTNLYYTQPQPVPAAPSNLAGIIDSSTQIRLQWSDNSTNEAGFRLLRKAGASGSYTTNVLAGNTTSYTDTGLTGGVQYFYKIRAYNSSGNSADSAEISLATPSGPPPISVNTTASFVGRDSSTSGSWRGTYGTVGGVAYPSGSISPPSVRYVQIAASQNSPLAWADSTTDSRALQESSGTNRFAAGWYSTNSFFFYLAFANASVHQVSFYFLDFDRQARQQRLEFFDDDTGELLGAETISNFEEGVYSSWNLRGNVRVKVTRLAGPNCVLSGLFFDPQGAEMASFIAADYNTSGTWKGVYGSAGRSIAAETSRALPIGTSVTFSGASAWVWNSTTTNPAALERAVQSGRIASAWYAPSQYTASLNFNDSAFHDVSFYFVDFDSLGREQLVELLDPATGNILDSTELVDFGTGVWLRYRIKNGVDVRITSLNTQNAVMSGVLVD